MANEAGRLAEAGSAGVGREETGHAEAGCADAVHAQAGTAEGRIQRYDRWMLRALAVATGSPDAGVEALGARVAPEVVGTVGVADVPVGAVVFGPDGEELATGRNERELALDPTAHAEMVALRGAAVAIGRSRLEGCTLVVTLEPCTMCAGALVLARIEAVVFGAWEPKTGAVGSLWDVVRDRRLNHRPEVYGGVRHDECAAILRAFFEARRGTK